jgi:hypothetical protein
MRAYARFWMRCDLDTFWLEQEVSRGGWHLPDNEGIEDWMLDVRMREGEVVWVDLSCPEDEVERVLARLSEDLDSSSGSAAH